MVTKRRIGLVVALLGAAAIAWSQVALVLAAPAPKATVGVVYTTTGTANIGGASYTVVADMIVPPGKYHVSAAGTVNNQTGAPVDSISCNGYGGTTSIPSGTTSVPLQYAGFAIEGAVDLPSGGTIRVECISSVASEPLPLVGVSLVAESVAGIVALP